MIANRRRSSSRISRASKKAAKDASDAADSPLAQVLHADATVATPLDPKPVSKKSVIVRTVTACLMTGAYMVMLMSGHLYCILAGVCTQVELFRELVNVRYSVAKEREIPLFRTIQWCWFFVAMGWVYGERLHAFFMEREAFAYLLPFTSQTATIVFVCYCMLFVASVLTLRQSVVKFQLGQYIWTIVIICLVVLQCKFFASYTLKGLFWFWFPMATVVMNDVSAYFCGITMGRKYIKRPFIALSPSKTWEGFLGAFVLTLIFSFFFPALLAKFSWLTCPAAGLYIKPFPPALVCEPHWVFTVTTYNLNWRICKLVGLSSITLLPIQLHGLAYGLFASVIAPFGGFFASAIKRAYEIKDFDSIFPGHGGMMDRMDCQLLMMTFTSFHYKYFINSEVPTIQYMISMVATMSHTDQLKLLQELTAKIK